MSLTKSVQFIDYYQVESDKKINQVLVDVNSIVLNQERILKHIEHLIQKRERRNPLNFFRQRTKSTPSQYGYLQPNEIDVVRGITEQTTYLGRSMKNVVSLQEQMLKMLEKDYTPMQDVKQQYEKRQNRREGPLVDRVLNKLRRKSRNAIIDARLFVLIKKEKLEDKIDELKVGSLFVYQLLLIQEKN